MLFAQTCKYAHFLPSERDGEYCGLFSVPQRPKVTSYRVNTAVDLGWVGAPDERALFRFHDVVVGFVDRCLPS